MTPVFRLYLALTLALTVLNSGLAQRTALAQTDSPENKAGETKPAASADSPAEEKGLQIQQLDDPATKLKPIKPRSAEEDARVNARAWYMAGRVHQQKQDFRAARDAYEKVRELDPEATYVYRDLIEIYFSLRQPDEAVKLAIKAVEFDPTDYQLLRTVGFEMLKQRKVAEAIKYIELARKSPAVDQKSGFYVLINKDLGFLYANLGEADKAADCYEVVLQALLKPSDFGLDSRTVSEFRKSADSSFERIGTIMLAAKRADLALTALERAQREQRGKPSVINLLLAELYHQKENEQKALEQLLIFFESNVQRGRTPYVLFRDILTKLEDEASLMPRLEALSSSAPENQELSLFLAETYLANDRLEDAEKIYLAAVKERPTNGAYLGLTKIYRQQNKPREVLDHFAPPFLQALAAPERPAEIEAEFEAIVESSSLVDALIKLGKDDLEAAKRELPFASFMLLAEVSSESERYNDAEAFYRHSLKINPAQAGLIVRQFGSAMLAAERYETAAVVYDEATQNPLLQGNKAQNFLMLATARELNTETDKALAAIGTAAKLVPDNYLIEYREAWIYYHAHQYQTAAEKYEAYIAKHKTSPFARQAQFSLSAIYVELGDLPKGEKILEDYLAENPDDPGVNNDLGYLYADQGKNLEKARGMIEKAVAAEPENAAYLDSMGWVLFKLKEFEKARDWLQKAVDLKSGNDSTIWDHLGDCHRELNATDKAREAYTTALRVAEEDKPQDEELIGKIKTKLDALKPAEAKPAAPQADAK